MTLIASFIINTCPIIVGDLLISRGVSNPSSGIQIPAIPNINQKLGRDFNISVTGMKQKVNIISDNLCIAWAGSYIQARTLIKYLRERTNGQVVSNEQYTEILDAYPSQDLSDLEVLSYFYDHEKSRFNRRNVNLPFFPLADADDVQVGGTGRPEFVRQFLALKDAAFVGDANPLAQAVARAMVLCNSFWGLETINGGGLGEGWGGGFEVAFFDGGKFKKVSNILNLYWTARQSANDGFELKPLPRFMKVDYEGALMRIFVSDSSEGESQDALFIVNSMFDTPPYATKYEHDNSYEWLNSIVWLELLDGSKECLSLVNRFGNEFKPVIIQTSPTSHEMSFHQSYLENLKNIIEAKLAV